MTDDAIAADRLERSFRGTPVLSGLDLRIPRGSVYGLLGPNGAGKTTLVRILSTLLTPQAGMARVLGHDVVADRNRVRRLLGLTGQYASVDDLLTGRENLVMFARLLGLSAPTARRRADALLEQFDLADAATARTATYSGGMRRRLDLAAGFSAAQVAPAITLDLTEGTIDRLRAMGTSPVALLTGHVLANVARNVVSTIGVVLLALLMGFDPRAGILAWLAAAGVAVAFMVAIATVSATMGIAAGSPEAASGFTFFVLFLPYLSTGFVPPQTLPSVVRGFAEHQPMTPVIEAMRSLLLGGPAGTDVWLALAWCVGIVAVSVPVATWLFRRRTAPR